MKGQILFTVISLITIKYGCAAIKECANEHTTGPNDDDVMGGSSCSDPDVLDINGTIGLVSILNNQPTVVGAMSVFAMSSEDPVSQKVMTPSQQRGGVYPNDFIGFTWDGWYGPEANTDLSIAPLQLPLRKQYYYNQIFTVGRINGYADARIGEKVKKYGAGTGYTLGIVTSVTYTVTHGGTKGFPAFTLVDQIAIVPETRCGSFSDVGDIGAFVVNEDNMVVGMILGQADQYSYATPSKVILRYIEAGGPK